MIRTLIFDLDLTLVDSLGACVEGTNMVARHFGLAEKGPEEVLAAISLPLGPFWEAMWGRLDPAWQEYFDLHVADAIDLNRPLYPGCVDLLQVARRQGIVLGVATNRMNPWLDLASMGIAQYFDTAVGPESGARPKPFPDIPQLAVKQLHADASSTVLIGDSAFDMNSARDAGIRALGLTQGGTTEQELMAAGAWLVRRDLPDVTDFLSNPGGIATARR
jgi:HAD superfamily hydrolase (TIGR01509 family)